MNISEKATAYDAILERAKEYLKNCPKQVDAKDCIEYLIPEIVENDEKIRTAIKNVIKHGFDLRKDCHRFFDDFTKEEMITYLDKIKRLLKKI